MTSRVLPPNTGLRFACCPHCPRFCVGYHLLDCRYLCRFRRWGMAWQSGRHAAVRAALAEAQAAKRERKTAKSWKGTMR